VEKTLGFLGTYNVDLSYSIKVKKPVMEFWFLVRRRRGIRKAQWEKISESHWAHNDRAEHGGKEREMEKRQMCFPYIIVVYMLFPAVFVITLYVIYFILLLLYMVYYFYVFLFLFVVVCFLIFVLLIIFFCFVFCVLFVCFCFFCFFVFVFCCCLFYGLLLDFLHLIINYVCVFLFVLLFFCCIFYF